MENGRIKWAAALSHVSEVSLLGAADLEFWKNRLAVEELVPAELDGKAQILVVAGALRYMGVRFQELSVSILVLNPRTPARGDAAYLLGAWNSCRFFAWCERLFFSTPYRTGDVRVYASLPASVRILDNGEVVFGLEMGADDPPGLREPLDRTIAGWEGPVFLPAAGAGSAGRKAFFARIRGQTETYPFVPARDSLVLQPNRRDAVLDALRDSNFVPTQWIIRPDALHAKSRTYARQAVQ